MFPMPLGFVVNVATFIESHVQDWLVLLYCCNFLRREYFSFAFGGIGKRPTSFRAVTGTMRKSQIAFVERSYKPDDHVSGNDRDILHHTCIRIWKYDAGIIVWLWYGNWITGKTYTGRCKTDHTDNFFDTVRLTCWKFAELKFEVFNLLQIFIKWWVVNLYCEVWHRMVFKLTNKV